MIEDNVAHPSTTKDIPVSVGKCGRLAVELRQLLVKRIKDASFSRETKHDVLSVGLLYDNEETGKISAIAETHSNFLQGKIDSILKDEDFKGVTIQTATVTISEKSTLLFVILNEGMGEKKQMIELLNTVIADVNRQLELLGATKLISPLKLQA